MVERRTATGQRAASPWIRGHAADAVDFFVYVVVLNLAVEYLPSVISETFTLSLLTALLLKVTLEVVLRLKSRVIARLTSAPSRRGKVTWAVILWTLAAGSKFVVLELVALVFADQVSLGGFIPVTLLVVALLLARAGVRWLLYGRETKGVKGPTQQGQGASPPR